jgi:hypothetical protein
VAATNALEEEGFEGREKMISALATGRRIT